MLSTRPTISDLSIFGMTRMHYHRKTAAPTTASIQKIPTAHTEPTNENESEMLFKNKGLLMVKGNANKNRAK